MFELTRVGMCSSVTTGGLSPFGDHVVITVQLCVTVILYLGKEGQALANT